MNVEEISTPKQIWLLNFKNPLKERLGAEFFRQIPKAPGVYWMLGQSQEVLYVGKAKNLQNRLKSYPRVNAEQASRKIMQLVYLVREIRWEICESEEAALLKENQLLRTLKPPFNWMNTHPENYLYFGICLQEEGLDFRLRRKFTCIEGEELFGAFKGGGFVQRSYGALLRLVWWVSFRQKLRFELPPPLVRRRPPEFYPLSFEKGWSQKRRRKFISSLRRFLRGTSTVFLKELTSQLLDKEGIPAFYYHYIQKDLELLEEFYEHGPRRNWRLKTRLKLGSPLCAQEELDDFLVKFRLLLNERGKE